jgi:hypothetical protein
MAESPIECFDYSAFPITLNSNFLQNEARENLFQAKEQLFFSSVFNRYVKAGITGTQPRRP